LPPATKAGGAAPAVPVAQAVTSSATARQGKNILAGPVWGFKNLNFVFLMAHYDVLYIFERRRGPERRGAWGNLPLYPPLAGPVPSTLLDSVRIHAYPGGVAGIFREETKISPAARKQQQQQ